MRKICIGILMCFLVSTVLNAQVDSIRVIEEDKETSFENYELLIIAIVGFIILMGLYFFFKRTRR